MLRKQVLLCSNVQSQTWQFCVRSSSACGIIRVSHYCHSQGGCDGNSDEGNGGALGSGEGDGSVSRGEIGEGGLNGSTKGTRGGMWGDGDIVGCLMGGMAGDVGERDRGGWGASSDGEDG